jgi:hypothetical protein
VSRFEPQVTFFGKPFRDMIPMRTMTDMQGACRISDPVQVMLSDTVRAFKPVPPDTIGPRSSTLQFEIR